MKNAVLQLRLAIERRKWILWAMIATVLVVAWFVVVSLLPHHVINTIQGYEEQANGDRGPGHLVRESP